MKPSRMQFPGVKLTPRSGEDAREVSPRMAWQGLPCSLVPTGQIHPSLTPKGGAEAWALGVTQAPRRLALDPEGPAPGDPGAPHEPTLGACVPAWWCLPSPLCSTGPGRGVGIQGCLGGLVLAESQWEGAPGSRAVSAPGCWPVLAAPSPRPGCSEALAILSSHTCLPLAAF